MAANPCPEVPVFVLRNAVLPLWVLLLLLGGSMAQAEDDGQKLKAGDRDPAFLERVNRAIDSGAGYVKGQQGDDGAWRYKHVDGVVYDNGCTALCLLALLNSGVNRNDPCIEKGFGWLRRQPFRKVYGTALTIMAVEARYRENLREERIRGELTRVVKKKPRVPKPDLEWLQEAVRFLLDNREYTSRSASGAGEGDRPAWSYPRKKKNNWADHSNSQFGILGLKAASRCGLRVPMEAFKKALIHFLGCQEASGPKVPRVKMIEDRKHGYVSYRTLTRNVDEARGWAYGTGIKPLPGSKEHWTATSGSMTCVGVASILLCASELGPRDLGRGMQGKVQKAVYDGLAWMAKHFTVEKNPGHPEGGWLYYYLYGIERAAVLANVRNIGTHDWYREGAEFLLGRQDTGGEWREGSWCDVVPATSLALLFLTKATVPVHTKVTGGGRRR
jgi:hypothetical protein